ncbi:MAG: holo-ACP synthase [Solirubrobacteraceae bacterium]|jgi:holo-[acyl-carrier protein] synthase
MVPAETRLRVGVDAVEVARLERLLAEHPDSPGEIFTARELAYCAAKKRSGEHLAARFAAKEAVLKAFGTGVSRRLRLTEVEVVNDDDGRPQINLDGAAATYARRHGLAEIDVSLTHTRQIAIANVVSRWRPPGTATACAST